MKNKKANYSQESYPANGWSSYNDEINENKKKITNALGISCKGLLILSFSIDDQGTPVDFKITQPINNECDNAGVKIISDGPKWIKFNDKRIVYQIEF